MKLHNFVKSIASFLSKEAIQFIVRLENFHGLLASQARILDQIDCISSSEVSLHLSKKLVIQSSSMLSGVAVSSKFGRAHAVIDSILFCIFHCSVIKRTKPLCSASLIISICACAFIFNASASADATRRVCQGRNNQPTPSDTLSTSFHATSGKFPKSILIRDPAIKIIY